MTTYVTVSQVYAFNLTMTRSYGLINNNGRIVYNAKEDRIIVGQLSAKNTLKMLKKVRRQWRRQNSTMTRQIVNGGGDAQT